MCVRQLDKANLHLRIEEGRLLINGKTYDAEVPVRGKDLIVSRDEDAAVILLTEGSSKRHSEFLFIQPPESKNEPARVSSHYFDVSPSVILDTWLQGTVITLEVENKGLLARDLNTEKNYGPKLVKSPQDVRIAGSDLQFRPTARSAWQTAFAIVG